MIKNRAKEKLICIFCQPYVAKDILFDVEYEALYSIFFTTMTLNLLDTCINTFCR